MILSCFIHVSHSQEAQTNSTDDTYMTIDQSLPLGNAQILSYNDKDELLFSVNASNLKDLNTYTQPELSDVAYFVVGEGPIQLELWSPFGENGNSVVAPALLLAVNDWVVLSRNTSTTTGGSMATLNGNDTVTVKVVVGDFNSDWMAYCGENGVKCPDMVILGTTQIALHAAHGTIKPLDDLFTEYTEKQNSLLVDSFLKYTFYDYQWNEHWWAVPLLTDVRLTYYNRTTLRALNIKPPPPEGDWGIQWWDNWNWTVFLENAQKVKDSGIGYGLEFVGQYDEETKLMNMISRDWQVDFFKTDETSCGLQNDAFNGILDNIVRPLWAPINSHHGIANPLKLTSNASSFLSWLKTPIDQVQPTKVDPAGFCCDYDLWPTDFLAGYRIDTPANFNYTSVWIKDWAINSTNLWDNSTEIGVGLAPGVCSVCLASGYSNSNADVVLGGSGLAISSTTEYEDLAWDFIQMVINPLISDTSGANYEYLNVLNEANGIFPPYETTEQLPPWTAPSFYTARTQIAHAVPMQYPHSTSPSVSSIEDNHVFRQMIFNMAFKNATNEQAISQTCNLLQWLMAPDCSYEYWTITKPDICNSNTGTLEVTFSWTNSTPVCQNGVTMPSTYSIPCSYVDITTSQGTAITVLNSFCAVVSILYMILLAIYRNTQSIALRDNRLDSRPWILAFIRSFVCDDMAFTENLPYEEQDTTPNY
ncbi:hypothetical protein INT43_001174 [Umbelopsis isabellina]|uniref:Uncharacterized protein n=1 Tax=Mortierella isabellina TaxID=91625 RepID=A0A8H7PK54_MORIS|nr:hypothetical protein INT43_001174 [Umbelopsis isabellina]